jgi:hypothetical protein
MRPPPRLASCADDACAPPAPIADRGRLVFFVPVTLVGKNVRDGLALALGEQVAGAAPLGVDVNPSPYGTDGAVPYRSLCHARESSL